MEDRTGIIRRSIWAASILLLVTFGAYCVGNWRNGVDFPDTKHTLLGDWSYGMLYIVMTILVLTALALIAWAVTGYILGRDPLKRRR